MTIKSKMTENTLKDIEKITGAKLTLGRLIWAIRESNKISQVDFAKKLNITKQHLRDIEHGRQSVSPGLAAQYANMLGYSKNQFIQLSLKYLVDRKKLHELLPATDIVT